MTKKASFCHFTAGFLWIISLLAVPIEAAHTEDADTDTKTPERVLHFSDEYSIGKVYIENESIQHQVQDIKLWVNGSDWRYLAPACNDVTIPAGHRVKLTLTGQIWENHERIKDLAKLAPDAVYALGLQPTKWSVPSDWLTAYIASLTGLKELHLRAVRLSHNSLKQLNRYTELQFLHAPEGLTNGGLKEITQIKTLKALHMMDSQLTDKGLTLLKDLPQLEELMITGEKLTDEALSHIAAVSELKHLYLAGEFSNGSMAHLKECSNLKILSIHIDNFNDKGMWHISGIPNLERFAAHWMKHITDKGVSYLKNTPKLKMLDVHHAKLTDKSLRLLGTMTSLEYLQLPFDGLTDSSVEMLSQLKNLKFLWIGTSSNSTLTNRSMQAISQLTQLEELYIGGESITDEGVTHLSNLKQLRKLLICYDKLTDRSLETISNLKKLEHLSLDPKRPFSTDGLNRLNRLTNLKLLSIRKAKKGKQPLNISSLKNLEHLFLIMDQDYKRKIFHSLLDDEDIECFENLNRLSFFCISGAEITDEGFKTITGLPRLQNLQLFGPARMTDDAFLAFSPNSPIGSIRLDKGHFTGTCLEHFAKLENLNNLELTSDTAWDKKSVHEFKKKNKLRKLELKP